MHRTARHSCMAATLALASFAGSVAGCKEALSKPAAEPAPNIPDVRNPSGDCPAPDNGARPDYAPGDNRWLPDCNAPLHRQYFRVFAASEQLAFMIPRPDGVVTTRAVCEGEAAGSELRALFDRYTLCSEQPDIDRVNAMTPVDGLAIAHALHEHLRFQAQEDDVVPHPETSDVLAVCAELKNLANSALSGLCKWEQDRDRRRRAGEPLEAIARLPSAGEGPPLAAALNDLYGIAL